MPPEPAIPDPTTQRAVMIARAERRRAELEELAKVGMALAKEVAVRFIDGPYHPEPRLDPGRSYAAISRSIRLTFTLESRVDEKILALCMGAVPAAACAAVPTPQACPQDRRRFAGSSSDGQTMEFDRPEVERESLFESDPPDLAASWGDDDDIPTTRDVRRTTPKTSAPPRVEVGDYNPKWHDDNPGHRAVLPPRSEGGRLGESGTDPPARD